MAKCVGIDVGEIVTFAKLTQPVRYAVWVHWLSVVLSKHKALRSEERRVGKEC